ncbi:hypothetical protein AMK06_CH03366 [Rhizobium sp. N541]|uniref:DUF6626 family protein n=1 Tax=unclassified Rhizobium TaxID=2613769 RepID=UPI0007EE7F04|nr:MULTISPECIES: DUF6626 family protein [unclassified Rhizobium]ANM18240.1 hypothetical protein AMK06_CH03366 [Rhizobium sp. N541]ANM24626.1 hypothetical protein AMK07_CH03364 [Rhizobium sp. N941]
MVSDIKLLETICEHMQKVGLVQSKADFSTRMLGKGPSYLTSMSARDRKVPDQVIAFFTAQLQYGVADDDAIIAHYIAEAKRHEHDRRQRTEMLERVARLRTIVPVQEPQHQNSVTPFTLGQRFVDWLLQNRIS